MSEEIITQAVEQSDTQVVPEKKIEQVPLSKLLEKREQVKLLEQKLKEYEDKDRQLAEQKLLEEKNYQELIQIKENKLKEYEESISRLQKQTVVNEIKTDILTQVQSAGIIDSEIALKLFDLDSLSNLDSISRAKQIETEITALRAKKAYLFGSKTNRDSVENKVAPVNQPTESNSPFDMFKNSKKKVEDAFARVRF